MTQPKQASFQKFIPLRVSLRLWKTISSFLGKRVIWAFFWSFLSGVFLSGVEFIFSLLIQVFFTSLGLVEVKAITVPEWLPTKNFPVVLAIIFGAVVLRGALQWWNVYLQGAIQDAFRHHIRARVLRDLFTQSRVNTSRLTTIFGERATQGGQCLFFLQNAIVYLTNCVFLIFGLFIISPMLTAISFAVMLFLFITFFTFGKRIQLVGKALVEDWNRSYSRLTTSIRNILFLRISGMESQEQARMQSIIDSYLKSALGYYRVEGFLYALPQVLGVILICIVSIGAHEKNFLAPGALLSYIYLLVRCLQGFSVIFSMGSNFLLRIPQIREIYRWWSFSELPITQEIRPNFNAKKDLSLQIESPIGWHLKDLTFSYPLGSPLFSPINCEIKPASALVITGASGAGKTTLLNLLIGELSPTNGKIALTINGDKLPLSEVRPTILRTLGYVGPEPFIVPGTILQNLMYGLEAEASTEAIKEAVTLAKCDFIGALPRGLHHVISEQGEGLSAGQKQRLMLARALLRNPKALILDEPTANLDPEAENFLVHTFSILKKRMTLLIVTHRTAFLPLADKLIDLSQNPKQGELV